MHERALANTFIGIDIGKTSIHICKALEGKDPRAWMVEKIAYDQPNSWLKIEDRIPSGAIVVVEPTGWNYLLPLVNVLPNTNLYLIKNKQTQHIRAVELSDAKTDILDAQALAIVAQRIGQGVPPRGVRPFAGDRIDFATHLRHYVNRHDYYKKQRKRLLNQFDAFAHAIFPILATKKNAYRKCLDAGFHTPAEIHQLCKLPREERPEPVLHGSTFNSIKAMLPFLPDIDIGEMQIVRLLEINEELHRLDFLLGDSIDVLASLIEGEPFGEITRKWRTVPVWHGDFGSIAISALLVATNGQPELYSKTEFQTAVGWSPTARISNTIKKTKKSRTGYRPALNAVYKTAFQLQAPQMVDNPIRRYAQTCTTQRKRPACCRKLAGILSGIARHPSGEWKN